MPLFRQRDTPPPRTAADRERERLERERRRAERADGRTPPEDAFGSAGLPTPDPLIEPEMEPNVPAPPPVPAAEPEPAAQVPEAGPLPQAPVAAPEPAAAAEPPPPAAEESAPPEPVEHGAVPPADPVPPAEPAAPPIGDDAAGVPAAPGDPAAAPMADAAAAIPLVPVEAAAAGEQPEPQGGTRDDAGSATRRPLVRASAGGDGPSGPPLGLEPPPLPGERRRRRATPRAGRGATNGSRGVGRREAVERRQRRAREQRAARPGGSLRGRVLGGVAVVVLAAVVWFAVSLFQPFHGSGHGSVSVRISRGEGVGAVGSTLARDGVVSSGFFFKLRAYLSGKRSDIHPGTFTLQKGMSYGAALTALTRPPPVVHALSVLVPEGKSRVELAQLAHADGLRGSYLAASLHSPLLNPRHYGAPASTPNLEGFLFPATYELTAGASAATLVDDQLRSFHDRLGAGFVHGARRLGETPYDALIVASMVEREAATARDRPLVASVIYNRLRLHMPLGIDSTIRYALNDWTQPLTVSQLALRSPYNTRLHAGLPPTPIGNPGLASIDAALHPAAGNDLYFVVKPCGNGEQVFESSYAQFLRDSARYQAARAARGGRSPAACR